MRLVPSLVCVSKFAEKKTHLPKGMIVTQGNQTVTWLTAVSKTCIKDETVNTIPRYSLTMDKAEHAHQHLQARRKDDRRLIQIWKNRIQLNEKYPELRFPFFNLIGEFPTKWEGHPVEVVAAIHCNSFNEPRQSPIQQNPYRAGPRHCEIVKRETAKMLAEAVLEAADKWFSPKVFLRKKNGSPYLWVDKRKWNTGTVCDS